MGGHAWTAVDGSTQAAEVNAEDDALVAVVGQTRTQIAVVVVVVVAVALGDWKKKKAVVVAVVPCLSQATAAAASAVAADREAAVDVGGRPTGRPEAGRRRSWRGGGGGERQKERHTKFASPHGTLRSIDVKSRRFPAVRFT